MMTDADGLLAARFAATRDGYDDSDWNDVLVRRPSRRTRPRALLVAAAVVAALAIVALATPLGAAIVDGVGGFSAWIRASPARRSPNRSSAPSTAQTAAPGWASRQGPSSGA
jgi:hypothetical protein